LRGYDAEMAGLSATLTAVVVGSGAAVVGFAASALTTRATLRVNRQIARDERLWKAKVEVYEALVSWTERIAPSDTSKQYGALTMPGESLIDALIPELGEVLDSFPALLPKTAMYASTEVRMLTTDVYNLAEPLRAEWRLRRLESDLASKQVVSEEPTPARYGRELRFGYRVHVIVRDSEGDRPPGAPGWIETPKPPDLTHERVSEQRAAARAAYRQSVASRDKGGSPASSPRALERERLERENLELENLHDLEAVTVYLRQAIRADLQGEPQYFLKQFRRRYRLWVIASSWPAAGRRLSERWQRPSGRPPYPS
jgi:hypothetical protein